MSQHPHHGNTRGEEREQGIANRFEKIMIKNFPNLVKGKDTPVLREEAQRVSNKLGPKRPTLKHIIIKMARPKYKERILNATREKQVVTYKREYQLDCYLISQQKHLRPEWSGRKYAR